MGYWAVNFLKGYELSKDRTPTHDSPKAVAARHANRDYSWCLRCGMPWSLVDDHTTYHGENHRQGLFPLCEGCWVLLGSPEARIEYYKKLVDWWEELGEEISDDTKRDIRRAVANGG